MYRAGSVARLVFYSIEFAGQVMATEMGLMMSAQIDPISRTNSTPVGIALFYIGLLLFLFSGSHHLVFAAFLRSFDIAPIGMLKFSHDMAELFVSSTGKIFLVGVQMAAPLMAVNFIVTFTFAVLGKAAPGINVFTESFSVRILAGLANVGIIQRVLQNLLREGIPIKNLPVILECIADFAPLSKNPDDLSEQSAQAPEDLFRRRLRERRRGGQGGDPRSEAGATLGHESPGPTNCASPSSASSSRRCQSSSCFPTRNCLRRPKSRASRSSATPS